MSPRRDARARTLFVALLALIALVALSASCTSRGTQPASLRGARLQVIAVWSGTEQRRFAAVIREFEADTGAVVRYTPAGHSISDVLAAREARHELPDVAFIPQPGLLREYAHDRLIVPLDAGTVTEVARNYP